jgi:radical SAM superfamily enzyme YgiQ (UPF0313 family)
MKILFLNSSRAGKGSIPLNIPLLLGVLKRHNHEVCLFDMTDYDTFNDKSYESMFFKEASYDVNKIVQDRINFKEKNSFNIIGDGINLLKSDYSEDFEKLLVDFKPDIIAVSCLSIDFSFICDFLLHFKMKYKIPVIFGGIHAILNPEETISSQVCDIICTGEGENSLPLLLQTLENGKSLENVKGLWFKGDNKIIKNPAMPLTDLKTLPFPNYEHFDPVHFYRPFDGNRYKMLNYELSRGCPFKCSYCVNGVLQEKYKDLGNYHRNKDIKHSINELKHLVNKYNFDFIRFWDEDFTMIKTSYLEQFAQLYLKNINLPFLIYSRVDTVTEKKVIILKEMGCKTFAMGIESGNEYIRQHVMKRKMTNKTIIDKFNLVKSFGIRTSAYNIIGLPYEDRDKIFDTIELNRIVNPDSFSVTYLEPYKGTPIRTMCEDQGLDPDYEVIQHNVPHFIPKSMTCRELKGLYRTFPFYIRFPKEKYNEIQAAETNDNEYLSLQRQFVNIK